MAVVSADKLPTGPELLALGDIGPCELIEGRIVPLSPTGDLHGGYESNFAYYFRDFVRQRKVGHVRVGEVGLYIRRNPDTVRGADLAYISAERYAKRKQQSGFLDVAPELIVEIMSPDDRWVDVSEKLNEDVLPGFSVPVAALFEE
jgi:Uma2 family endonuclease